MVNTGFLDEYTMFSSISLTGSNATLACKNLVIDGTSSYSVQVMKGGNGTAVAPTFTFISDMSNGFYRSGTSKIALSYSQLDLIDGSAVLPSLGFRSEMSLGLYRSAASRMHTSYGQFIVQDGTAVLPPLAYKSEVSLGLYRSAASNLVLSYGTLSAPTIAATSNLTAASAQVVGAMTLRDGSALIPSFAFASEASLGLFRSAASTIKPSYGTLDLSGCKVISRTTASSNVSLLTQLNAGEFIFVAGAAGAGSDSTLAFRVGNTLYCFTSAYTVNLA
jgi:hypothetical protein